MPQINMNAIFMALPTSLAILKPTESDFITEEVNNAFAAITGINRKNIINKPFLKTIRGYTAVDHAIQFGKVRSAIVSATSSNRDSKTDILKFSLPSSSVNRESLYLQFKCSPVLNIEQEVENIVVAIEDVTDLLTVEEKQRNGTNHIRSREELVTQAEDNKAQFESASRELDDFVYSVSHDLRAPLRRIDGFSQELLNEYSDRLDGTGAHYLDRVRQGAQDMGQLIDDLLKLSRISRKKVEKEQINLGEIASSVFNELMELESGREVSFVTEGDMKVIADKGLLRAMLTNLISNALKFSSKEEVAEIKIGSKKMKGEIVHYIADNGVGFDPNYSDKLFKAFSRLHSHKEFTGTGIGLATVKRIMTLHGGSIWAESNEGKGATFFFKF